MRWSGHTYMTWQPKRQRGFIMSAFLAPAVPYIMIGAGVAMLGLGIAWKIQTVRLHASQTQLAAEKLAFSAFKSETKRLGDAAAKAAAAKTAEDKLAKEKADRENTQTVADLNTRIVQLRRERDRARSSIVPAAPAGSSRPDLACFDRPELERANRELFAAIRGGADEGSAATVDLNTAKRWAQGMKR